MGSLFFIAILVVFLDDFAYELGCTVGLEIRVTSLALVSVGTNLPGKIGYYYHHIINGI